jgi:hypothetical protein
MENLQKSNYIGVYYSKKFKKFCSNVTFNGVTYNCGTSSDPREAARLRDLKIIKIGAPVKSLQILKPIK